MSEQLPLTPELRPCPRWGCRKGCVCGGRSARELALSRGGGVDADHAGAGRSDVREPSPSESAQDAARDTHDQIPY